MTDATDEIDRDLTTRASNATGENLRERAPEVAHAPAQEGVARGRLAFGLLVFVLGVGLSLHLGMVSSDRFGEYYDDAIYVTAAKSLATGQGYRMISLPQPIPQTLIPPLYPLLLSMVWRAFPQFPENLVWMMFVSVIAMMGFALLSWEYLVKNGYATQWQALAVVVLTVINWRTMSLATSTISEILFSLLLVAALELAEEYEADRSTWRTGAAMGLIAGLVFLTRTSGLVLLIAVATYYLYRRRWKKVVLPVSVAMLFVIGWFSWCYLNQNAVGGEHASYYAGYARGIGDTVGKLRTLNGESTLVVYLQMIKTNLLGLVLVWAPLQSLGLRATLSLSLLVPLIMLALILLVAGFVRETRNGIRLLEIYCVFHLGVHLIVPSHSYERYIMPIVPLLLFFLVRELSHLFLALRAALISSQSILTKSVAAIIGLVVTGAAVVTFQSNLSGIYYSLTDSKPGVGSKQDAQIFDWIKTNTEPESVLICFGDLKYYLYTGRKTVRSIPVNILDLTVYQAKDPDLSELATVFRNIVEESRGSYVVLTPNDFRNQAPAYGASVEEYITNHPERFIPVFQSEDGRNRIYQIRDVGGMRTG